MSGLIESFCKYANRQLRKYNDSHDPSTGEFSSGDGGGSAKTLENHPAKSLAVGQTVHSSEHPTGEGKVIRVNDKGDATIEFTTPASSKLPYGKVSTEFWPKADQGDLT